MTHPPCRYILGKQNGPVVRGVCRCGAEKTWPASEQGVKDWVRAAQARRKEKMT